MPRTKRSATPEYAPDGRRIYSLGDVQAFTGATRANAEYWVRQQTIVPDYPASGSGNFQGFTFRNLVEFAIARNLGLSQDRMKAVLSGLRIDPSDAYEEMPRMRAAIERRNTRQRPPTLEAAKAWYDEQLKRYGVGGGRFTDPVWLAEMERYLPLIWPDSPLLQHAFNDEPTKEELHVLRRWRQFKNPKTRGDLTAILCAGHAAAWIAFTPQEVWKWTKGLGHTTTVNLRIYFEQLEKNTSDSWDGAGQK